jgi:hypothetical protein
LRAKSVWYPPRTKTSCAIAVLRYRLFHSTPECRVRLKAAPTDGFSAPNGDGIYSKNAVSGPQVPGYIGGSGRGSPAGCELRWTTAPMGLPARLFGLSPG